MADDAPDQCRQGQGEVAPAEPHGDGDGDDLEHPNRQANGQDRLAKQSDGNRRPQVVKREVMGKDIAIEKLAARKLQPDLEAAGFVAKGIGLQRGAPNEECCQQEQPGQQIAKSSCSRAKTGPFPWIVA